MGLFVYYFVHLFISVFQARPRSLQILESLDADPYCRKLSLAHRLQSIGYILESYSHAGPVAPMPPLQLAGQLSEL